MPDEIKVIKEAIEENMIKALWIIGMSLLTIAVVILIIIN